MHGNLGSVTVAALGIALSPLPAVLALVLIGARDTTALAASFVVGEALALGAVVSAVVFLAPEVAEDGTIWVSLGWLQVVVGVVLGVLLVLHLGRSPKEGSARLREAFERVGPGAAFAGGLAMVVANPKNLALALAGAAAILELEYSEAGEAVGIVVFTVAGISVLVGLLALASAFPDRRAALLPRAQALVTARERTLVTVLLAALAAFFLLRGVLGLAS